MELFLEKLAKELYTKHGDDISGLCIVFPSRRAGLFFKQYIARQIDKPIWLPSVFSVQDFIAKLSPQQVGDRLTLIFELFEAYKKLSSEESFDKFYPWGDMLLHDFDDIDKNLVESASLFRILREHKQVEMDFDFKVADIEEFYKFWQSFSGKELTDVQNNFIQTWEIIGQVYHSFRKNLEAMNLCYEGMAYRRVHELVRTKKLNYEWKKIIFAGFNLLNKAEEGIINELIKQGIAEIFWDADEYYLSRKFQEAGNSLRQNFAVLGINEPNWIEDNLLKDKKNIKIIGAPLKVSQAKVLGNELKEIKKDSLYKTAVVLPDESLLIPVLHSLPDSIGELNVTMGFPFKDSSLYSLLQLLRNLQGGKKGSGNSAAYYHKDVVQVLLHPYIKFTAPYEIFGLVNRIKRRNIIYISRKTVLESFAKQPEIISEIFNDIETSAGSLEYIYNIITLIAKQLESRAGNTAFEMEYLFKFYTEVNHLSDVINRYSAEMDKDTFWNLLLEIAGTIKIPFTGEPLKGLQVMGLLETRLLDFENVYILSMNEGTMPKGITHGSFIPYSLRRAFKMPTHEDDDANSAYYFYRIMQRAKNICLIYNTQPGEIFSGEKSRFLMQVENELVRENKNITIENYFLEADIALPPRKEIVIQKSSELIEALKNEKQFSATTIANYINCPLKFYLRTVAKLKEDEEVEEFFSGKGFGTILHQIMEMLYTDYVGKTVDKKAIKAMKDKINKDYDKVWEDACSNIPEYEEFKSGVEGKNLLFKNIIKRLVKRILDIDAAETPFKIISLEQQVTKEVSVMANGAEHKIKLLGRLDRVEEKYGIETIIDYKTGIIDRKKLKETINEENFDVLFSDPAYKEKFQQHFYSSIYLESGSDKKLKIGIYPLKNLSEGILFFSEEHIPKEILEMYDSKLQELLAKIFDPETPFTQAVDRKRCLYCAYRSICYVD
jgi:hypothetical protein